MAIQIDDVQMEHDIQMRERSILIDSYSERAHTAHRLKSSIKFKIILKKIQILITNWNFRNFAQKHILENA